MKKILNWEQIKQAYAGQWVELVDFEWEWHEAQPRRARVNASSTDRSSLLSQVKTRGEMDDSIILLVGTSSSLRNANIQSQSSEATL